MRFPIKPNALALITGVLPKRLANCSAAAMALGAVALQRTISISFITWAGLKKCKPNTREGLLVLSAISSIFK